MQFTFRAGRWWPQFAKFFFLIFFVFLFLVCKWDVIAENEVDSRNFFVSHLVFKVGKTYLCQMSLNKWRNDVFWLMLADLQHFYEISFVRYLIKYYFINSN